MRVLRISYRVPPAAGGKEQHVQGLTAAQLAAGHQVALVYAVGGDLPDGAEHVRRSTSRVPHRLAHVLFALRAAAVVYRRRARSDVVHLHGDFVEAGPVGWVARRCGLPLVCTVHGGVSRRYPRTAAWAFSHVDRFIALGRDAAGDLEQLAVPANRILRSHSGLDLRGLERRRATRTPVAHRVVSVGSLDPVKGHDVLIAAVGLLRGRGVPVELMVIGAGAEGPRLQALADSTTGVTLRGNLTRPEVYDELQRAAVFALASRPLRHKREGVPTAALEALALGLPVLLSDSVSLEPAVCDAAYVSVPTDDVEAWTKHLDWLLGDQLVADELARQAIAATARLDWDTVAAAVEEQYRAAQHDQGRGRTKVLEVTRTLDMGGVETLLVTRLAHADHRAFDYTVVALEARTDDLARRLRTAGVSVRVLSRRLAAVGVLRLLWLLWRSDADVVSVHSPLPAVCARLVQASRRRRPAQVTTVHSTSFRSPVAQLDSWRRRDDTLAVAVSSAVAEAGTCRGYRRVVTRRAGVDVAGLVALAQQAAGTRASLGLGAEQLVCQVASFRPLKDHVSALHAYALVQRQLPAARFVLVGDGPERARIELLAKELRLTESLTVLGLRDDAQAIIAASDLVVLSSRHEGLPVVVLEALAAGTPLVTTDVGGIRELVREGTDGLLVPVADPAALAKAIVAVLRGGLANGIGQPDRANELDIGETARWYERVYAGDVDLAVDRA